MKYPILVNRLFSTLLLLGFVVCGSAQVIHPATTTKKMATHSGPVMVLNSAYCAQYDGGTAGCNVYGVTWSDGYGHVSFVAGEDKQVAPVILPVVNIVPPPGYVQVANPDIVIGSDPYSTSTTNFLWLTVIYQATTALGATDMFMDVYTINSSYSGGLSYTTLLGSPAIGIPITTSGAVSPNSNLHIDGITSIQPTGVYAGMVSSNWFVMSWVEHDDVKLMCDNFRDAFDYYLHSGLLTASYATISAPGLPLSMADVAGVQRDNGASVDMMGLVTYCDANRNLYYQEWNIANHSLNSALMADTNAKFPRIDAVDVYTLNDIATHMAHYNISYHTYNALGNYTALYNDAVGAPQLLASTAGAPSLSGSYASVVYGPGNSYVAAYRVYTGGDDIYAQQVDETTGNLVSPDYQTVNDPASATNAMVGMSQLANLGVAPPNIFVCWYDYATSTIWYKTPTDPLIFRQDSTAGINEPAIGIAWGISPNPTSGEMTLIGTSSIPGDTYRIVDMTGRVLKEQRICAAAMTIDTKDLRPGLYSLQVLDRGVRRQTIKFAKQ